jgi:hypothetical protein
MSILISDEPLRNHFKSSLKVHPILSVEEIDDVDAPENLKSDGLSEKTLRGEVVCQAFEFDVLVLSVDGKICSDGTLKATINFLGINVGTITADLSKGKFCQSLNAGITWGQFCFYIKGDCLYTSGYVDGTFQKKQSWDERIVCF